MAEPVIPRRVAIAFAIDTAIILLFVAIGRESHDANGSTIANIISIAAPFLFALWFGWITIQAYESPMAATTGVLLWMITIIGGMLLRRFAFPRSTPLPFIIVTSLFTLATIVGWRVVHEWRGTRRSTST